MNIGIVTFWFERGAAYVSRAYMETLSKEHSVFIYARGGEETAIGDPRWNLDNVTWGKKLKDIDQGKYIVWQDFKKWLKKNKIDIIIFNEQQSWDVILRLRRSKYIIGAYVDYYTFEIAPWFKLYDFLLCNTQRHYEVFKEHEQAYLIQWGADTMVCRPHPRTKKSDEVVFFHSAGMGGINLRKGTDLVVQAFKNVHGPTRLIIHSQVGLEKYADVADLIKQDPRIQFIQGTYPLPGLYHLGEVYVYPSKLEGIGLSIVEAMACGLPVITTDAAPMNEFVENGRTGALVDVVRRQIRSDGYYWPECYCSIENLTERMQEYVDNPAMVQEQGKNARNAAVDQFNWETNSKTLSGLLGKVKKVRSWTRGDLAAIHRFEMAGNIFLQDAMQKIAQHRKGSAWRSLFRLFIRQPFSIVDEQPWRVIGRLLFSSRIKHRQTDLLGRISIKLLSFLPSGIGRRMVFPIVKRTILSSALFDPHWYAENNADVQKSGIDPLFHYLSWGASEGRNPGLFFDGNQYLAANPDVQRSGMNPLVHYLYFGKNEGRARFRLHQSPDQVVDSSVRLLPRGQRERRGFDSGVGSVDVILRTSGRLSDIRNCIESVVPTLRNTDRLILVDDCSDEATSEYLVYIQRILPEVVDLLQSKSATSLPAAINLGISKSKAEFIVILEDDAIVPKNWLSKLTEAAARDPSIGIISPISKRSLRQGLASMGIGDLRVVEKRLFTPSEIEEVNRHCGQLSEELGFAIVPFVQNSSILIKHEIFQKIGGFDEDKTGQGDEALDFCFRAADSGFQCVIATDVFINHGMAKVSPEVRNSRQRSDRLMQMKARYSPDRVEHARSENRAHPILRTIYTDIYLSFFSE